MTKENHSKELHSYINKELNNTYGFMGMKITWKTRKRYGHAQQVRALPTTFEVKPAGVEFDEAVIVPEGQAKAL